MTGSSLALVCSRMEVLLHRKAGFRRSGDNAGTLASSLLEPVVSTSELIPFSVPATGYKVE